MPQQDAVVAITSGTRDMGSVMNLVWDKLLPALQAHPLPPDDAARRKLENTLAGLTLPHPQGPAANAVAAQISGKTYFFPANSIDIDSVKLEFKGPVATLTVRSLGAEHEISIGNGVWKKGRTDFVAGADWRVADAVDQPVGASGAWTADDTYAVKLAYYTTPLAVTITCRFAGDRVLLLNVEHSVELGSPLPSAVLVGEVR